MVKTKRSPKKKYLVSLDEKLIDEVKIIQNYLSGADNLSGLVNTLLERWKKENDCIIEEFKCDVCGGKTDGLYISTCLKCKGKKLDESEKNGGKIL